MSANLPLVSIVIPFYNTVEWLGEAIESVLKQTYADFELILADNCSSDGSAEVARRFAQQDARIRYLRFEELLPQVPNYNRALTHMAPGAKYCKVVQADDRIMPECLERMVALAEAHPAVGLVSSYYLQGEALMARGLDAGREVFDGREIGALQLMGQGFYVGSPSAVMYRADIVRARPAFYRTGRLHEDTEAAYDILLEHDFGFVHQVLSFLRVDGDSIMGRAEGFNSGDLDEIICLHEYGDRFLTVEQRRSREREVRATYHRFLARSLLRFGNRDLWNYQRKALATIGETLPRAAIAKSALWMTVGKLLHPARTLAGLLRRAH